MERGRKCTNALRVSYTGYPNEWVCNCKSPESWTERKADGTAVRTLCIDVYAATCNYMYVHVYTCAWGHSAAVNVQLYFCRKQKQEEHQQEEEVHVHTYKKTCSACVEYNYPASPLYTVLSWYRPSYITLKVCMSIWSKETILPFKELSQWNESCQVPSLVPRLSP